MEASIQLKLKQASAVLGVPPKELQNLVQFGIVRPRKRGDVFWFDTNLLLQAKVALYIKASLRSSTDYLVRMIKQMSHLDLFAEDADVLRIESRPGAGQPPVEVTVPLRELKDELQSRMPVAELHRDVPRGRKRQGWKMEFLSTLESMGQQIGSIPEQEIAARVRLYRTEKKRPPEITVVPERKKTA